MFFVCLLTTFKYEYIFVKLIKKKRNNKNSRFNLTYFIYLFIIFLQNERNWIFNWKDLCFQLIFQIAVVEICRKCTLDAHVLFTFMKLF